MKSEIEKVVDDYIVAFCHNDRYVCLQIGLPPAKGKKSRTEEFQNISQYYIVDMEQNAKFGPFTEGQFVWESRTSDVGELSDWIPTDLKPHHAVVL